MATPSNKRWRTVQALVEAVCADYSIAVSNGGHLSVTMRRGHHSRKLFLPCTPGDHRGDKNAAANIRRVWRELAGLPR